jgi:antitoxin HicB
MARDYRVILEPEADGGFSVWVPTLPGCVSQGESLEEALANIREAIQSYVESALKHGEDLPDESAMTEATVVVPV